MTAFLTQNLSVITIWVGAICTLAIYSILYKENKLYRLFEHFFIGLGTGYGIYLIWTNVLYTKWWQPMVANGEWYWLFAFSAGALYYAIYYRKTLELSAQESRLPVKWENTPPKPGSLTRNGTNPPPIHHQHTTAHHSRVYRPCCQAGVPHF